ncbi:MAG: Uncharacterized MFS-type transporter, partial [uncultured Rubrobacteraceae bacterium]
GGFWADTGDGTGGGGADARALPGGAAPDHRRPRGLRAVRVGDDRVPARHARCGPRPV